MAYALLLTGHGLADAATGREPNLVRRTERMKKSGKGKRSLIRKDTGTEVQENEIVEKKSMSAAASSQSESSSPQPSERERVAEMRAVRLQAERQIRQHGRVMAREAEKTK